MEKQETSVPIEQIMLERVLIRMTDFTLKVGFRLNNQWTLFKATEGYKLLIHEFGYENNHVLFNYAFAALKIASKYYQESQGEVHESAIRLATICMRNYFNNKTETTDTEEFVYALNNSAIAEFHFTDPDPEMLIDKQKIVARLKRAISLDVTNPYLYYNLSFVLSSIGETEEALNQLKHAVEFSKSKEHEDVALHSYAMIRNLSIFPGDKVTAIVAMNRILYGWPNILKRLDQEQLQPSHMYILSPLDKTPKYSL